MFIFKHSTYINGAPPFLTTWSSPQFSWHILSNSRLSVAGLGGATGWQVHFSAWKVATEWRADADIRKNAFVFERINLLHPLKEKDLFKNFMAREQLPTFPYVCFSLSGAVERQNPLRLVTKIFFCHEGCFILLSLQLARGSELPVLLCSVSGSARMQAAVRRPVKVMKGKSHPPEVKKKRCVWSITHIYTYLIIFI